MFRKLALFLAFGCSVASAQSVVFAPSATGSAVFTPSATGSAVFGASSSSFNPSLIVGWPMTEGSGTSFFDVSGNADTATLSGTNPVTWQANTGFPGTTPLWNGTGKATASLTALTNLDGTAPFSVAAWIKNTQATSAAFASTINPASNSIGWEMLQNASAGSIMYLQFFLISNFGTGNYLQVRTGAAMPINDGNPHYVVVTYNGSKTAAGVALYVDAVLQANVVLNNSLTATTASGLPVTLASRNNGTLALTGVQTATAIYNGVLTQPQITAYFANGPKIN